jgi:hypothetical protein
MSLVGLNQPCFFLPLGKEGNKFGWICGSEVANDSSLVIGGVGSHPNATAIF